MAEENPLQNPSAQMMNLMRDAKLINAVDNLIYPLIDNWLSSQTHQLASYTKAGNTQMVLSTASYIAGLVDIRAELKRLQTKGNSALAKLHDKENP